MPAQRGPRGEKVTIVQWKDRDGIPHAEAYAAAGVRTTKHRSAVDKIAELKARGVECSMETVTVK